MAEPTHRLPFLGALIATAAVLYSHAFRDNQPVTAARAAARAPKPPRSSWGKILANVWAELDRDHIPIMAAGVAFYSLLSLFPGMSALISIYGLVSDPVIIEHQISVLAGILPYEALKLLSDQLHSLVAAPRAALGVGLAISLTIAMWSAMSGSGALMQALNVAFEERDTRGVLAFYLRALLLTIGTGLFGLVTLFLVAVVPAVIGWLPLSEAWQDRVSLIRWPILAGLVMLGLVLVYRFAPHREQPRWYWLSPGTIAAAILWLVGSAGFSFYVSRFSSYDKTYGSIGAVVILLMWFYVSAYIFLIGAELNSEYDKARHPPASEPQTPRGTKRGGAKPPERASS